MRRLPLYPLAQDLGCYVCGQSNSEGWRLRFFLDEEAVEAEWTAPARFEGWPGLLHGSGFAALHDEAAAWAMVGLAGRAGVTSNMQIHFTKAIRIGDSGRVTGRVQKLDERSGSFSTEIRRRDGTLLSRALTSYAFLDAPGMERVLGRPLDERFRTWIQATPAQRLPLLESWAKN